MTIGGQAVIEGVLMRSKECYAVAVRLPNGKIKVRRQHAKVLPRFAQLPFIRGIAALIYMLKDGIDALTWSSNQQLGKKEELSTKELAITVAISLIGGILVFVGVPFIIAGLISKQGIWFNIIDGLLRLIFLVGYLAVISRMAEMKRIFEYHGAEHKTIYCHEAQHKVTVSNVQKFPRQHHRCGTSFLFLVMLLSIFLFSFLSGQWYIKLGGRILLIPIIASCSYELLKLGDRFHSSWLMQIVQAPGIWLQEISTREPSDSQVEVAIKALEGVLRNQKN